MRVVLQKWKYPGILALFEKNEIVNHFEIFFSNLVSIFFRSSHYMKRNLNE